MLLRGQSHAADAERSRLARGDDALIAEMLAGGDAAARERSETGGPCSGVDFEEVENALTPQRVRDEARLPGLRLALALALALCVACIAAALDRALSALADGKLSRVLALARRSASAWPALTALAGANCCFVAFAAVCVGYLEPCAKGSGIPEIKAYLNGRRVPRVLHWRTVVAKLLGVLGSVSGQLTVGKEGPLIHAGAGLGANLAAGLAAALRSSRTAGGLTTPAAVRDLVSIGCACGVAGAFAAPIGGVLFVLEEAASPQFWHSSLTSLTFLAASAAALGVRALASLDTGHAGQMAQASLVHFGPFEGASRPGWYARQEPWFLCELPALCALGAAGGLGGAAFVALNVRLARWRSLHVASRRARVAEALLVSLATTACLFWLPALARCRPTATLPFELLPDSEMIAGPHCDGGSRLGGAADGGSEERVSVLGSLLLQPLDHSVRILFHTAGALPPTELLCCGLLLFSLACLAYGLAVPSGIFVPAIAVGACFGRAAGEALALAAGEGTTVDVGGMALVGAAAFLAGVTRVTLSAAVIVLETSSNLTYAPPVAIACLIAKATGDLLGHGLYDAHLRLQRIAFLGDSLPDGLRHLRAGDVASAPVVCVSEVASARALLLALRGCMHNGFPVTYSQGPGSARKFSGVITRAQLLVLLKRRAFLGGRAVDDAAKRADGGGGSCSRQPSAADSSFFYDAPAELGEEAARVGADGVELSYRAAGPAAKPARAASFSEGSAPAASAKQPSGMAKQPSGMSAYGDGFLSSLEDGGQGDSASSGALAAGPPVPQRSLSRQPTAPNVAAACAGPGPHASAGLRAAGSAPDALLPYRAFAARERRERTVADVHLDESELDRLIDLAPYMNAGALTVHPSAQLARVHLLFRSLGLRHLTLTDSSSTVIGIITRRDITDAMSDSILD